MRGDFDYEVAWHVLAGWVNSMAEQEDWRMPPRVRQELAAGYLFAVERGIIPPETEIPYPIRVAREALGMA